MQCILLEVQTKQVEEEGLWRRRSRKPQVRVEFQGPSKREVCLHGVYEGGIRRRVTQGENKTNLRCSKEQDLDDGIELF